MTLLERIRALEKGPLRVDVPEWGFAVWLRAWTPRERGAFLLWHSAATQEVRAAEQYVRAFILSAVDEAGALLCAETELSEWLDRRDPVIWRLGEQSWDLNMQGAKSEDTKSGAR